MFVPPLIVFFSLCFFSLCCFSVVFSVFFCYFLVGPKLAKVGLAKVEIGQSRTKPWPKSELAKVGRAPRGWVTGLNTRAESRVRD